MVFPSVPLYLDAPNWQQQANHHHGSSSDNPQLPPVVPTPVAPTGGAGSIRPGSMADRARMAKIPQPEAALKCPRCDSTNTKFCYFNNYSLSQPRHFCKTCRRYWTRGGALRNVPVGGGCRRNKRSKGSSSKSPASSDRQSGASSTSALASNSCTSDIVVGHLTPQPPQLPNFMASLHHHLAEYGAADIGLNFGGISPTVAATAGGGSVPEMDFPIVGNSSSTSALLSAGVGDQWRLPQVQQFPFMTAGLEPPPGLYPFEGEGVEPAYAGGATQLRAKAPSTAGGISHLGSIKMEESQGLNLSRQFMGLSGTDQFWGGGSAWTDLSGFSTPSTSHLF